ncbi:hypothetical protein [Paenibacillus sp. FSL L8-0494]|uniref:hypothetical protein n=1 Tax=Paenibacillus sp. FSL L8-0494 TaxID=2975352 RepID=UPI0030FA4B7A
MSVTLDKNAVQLAVIDGMIRESHETGFAQVTTHALNIMRIRYADLLAALEESQQQINEWQEEAKQWRDEFVSKNDELGEAQQTIARQREVLEFYANKEHWELPSFGRGHSKVTSDRGSKARELLEEGSDKA